MAVGDVHIAGPGGWPLCGSSGPLRGYNATSQRCRDCDHLERRPKAPGVPQRNSAWPLPPRVSPVPWIRSDYKLLVRMPTRSRPEQALSVLERYKNLAGCPVLLECIIDADDASMNTPDVLAQLQALGATTTIGNHKSKIEAVNGGRVAGWDVLLLASDDMVPVAEGYGARVLSAMAEHFPMLDGALHLDDGCAGQRLLTLPIIGKRLYDQFGYVYFPGYRSMWCDNEQTDVFRAMERVVYIPDRLVVHRHYVNQGATAPYDELYQRNDKMAEGDEALYRARQTRNFDTPVLQFSILIATMPSRAARLKTLTDELWRQALGFKREVEIIVDSGDGTTGTKRNRLLQKAKGRFIAFVDDDDQVASDYVAQIVGAIRRHPGADCVELYVVMGSQTASCDCHCSIKYSGWHTVDGKFLRCPLHLNPVKRELALMVGFPDKTIGEDMDYSLRLRPHLHREAPTDPKPLYFYYPSHMWNP